MTEMFGVFRVGGRQVWCTFVGDQSGRAPLVVVAGGPGASHLYLRHLEGLAAWRPVVFFDGLASGKSERIIREQWSPDDLIAEIEELVRMIGAPRFHLLGHSAASFAVFPYAMKPPTQLASLVLASCYPSIPLYHAAIDSRLASLSPEDHAKFVAAEHTPTLRDKRYVEIARQHITHMFHTPPPPDFAKGFDGATNVLAHRAIKGGSMYYTTSYATWDITARLGEIPVPTLITCGRHDLVTPEIYEEMQRRIPDAELAVFEHSAHMPHVEETEAYLSRLEAFLSSHD